MLLFNPWLSSLTLIKVQMLPSPPEQTHHLQFPRFKHLLLICLESILRSSLSLNILQPIFCICLKSRFFFSPSETSKQHFKNCSKMFDILSSIVSHQIMSSCCILHCHSNFILAQPKLKLTWKPNAIMTNCVLYHNQLNSSKQDFLYIVQLICSISDGFQTTTVGSVKADVITKNLKSNMQGHTERQW